MFEDFEQRFSPKSVDDIVFASEDSRELIDDLITGARPFPVTEGKCGILLYGIPGTGKSALAKLLPDAMERARGGEPPARGLDDMSVALLIVSIGNHITIRVSK